MALTDYSTAVNEVIAPAKERKIRWNSLTGFEDGEDPLSDYVTTVGALCGRPAAPYSAL